MFKTSKRVVAVGKDQVAPIKTIWTTFIGASRTNSPTLRNNNCENCVRRAYKSWISLANRLWPTCRRCLASIPWSPTNPSNSKWKWSVNTTTSPPKNNRSQWVWTVSPVSRPCFHVCSPLLTPLDSMWSGRWSRGKTANLGLSTRASWSDQTDSQSRQSTCKSHRLRCLAFICTRVTPWWKCLTRSTPRVTSARSKTWSTSKRICSCPVLCPTRSSCCNSRRACCKRPKGKHSIHQLQLQLPQLFLRLLLQLELAQQLRNQPQTLTQMRHQCLQVCTNTKLQCF